MPASVTNELLYEVLKQVQNGQAEVKATLGDVVAQIIRVREDINNLRSDDLRRERVQAQMDVRLERIEARLNLNDTSH
jgi:NTP pyrophosphatase (non-canonical NTP hydrolase)